MPTVRSTAPMLRLLLPAGALQDAAASRWAVRRWLAEQQVPAEIAADAVLVLGELVNNALVHSAGEIALNVCVSPYHVFVEVLDESAEAPRLIPSNRGAEDARGLNLVKALAVHWSFQWRAPGKVVWAAVALTRPPLEQGGIPA